MSGQAIFVDPASRLVLVQTAVRRDIGEGSMSETIALWQAVAKQFERRTPDATALVR